MPKNHYENYCIDDISPNCINVIGEEYNHPNFSSLTYEIIKNVGDHIDRFKRYPTFEDFCRWKRYKHLYDIEADEIYTMFPNVIRVKILQDTLNPWIRETIRNFLEHYLKYLQISWW